MTVQELAQKLSEALETRKRNNDVEFTCLKDGSPEWMTTVIRAVHGEKLPDDTTYEFISRAANALAEYDADGDEPIEAIYEIQPDIYTHDLTNWLGARADHIEYMDAAIAEYSGQLVSGFDLLQLAQKEQIDEVGSSLLSELEKLAD